MANINVAIIGAGSRALSLVQGVSYYQDAKKTEFVPGKNSLRLVPGLRQLKNRLKNKGLAYKNR